MPITLKKDAWKVKDPSSGQYRGAAILSTTLPQDAAQIISESNDTIQNIKDTAIDAVDTALNDESTGLIPKAEADRDAIDDSLNNASNGIIPTAQSDRDDIDDSLNNTSSGIIPEAQANLATIAQAVQSQIGQGTDKTLSVAKGFADAKAAGMMVKVSDYQPGSALDDPATSQDASQNTGYPVYKDSNRVWVKETYAELEVPTMDDVYELNDIVGNYLYSVTPTVGNSWAFIPIADRVSAGTTIYAQALSVSSNVESVRLVGQYSGERDLINLLDGKGHFYTTVLEYTDVKIAYKLIEGTDGIKEYSAICLKSDDPVSLSKDLFDTKQDVMRLSRAINSPFVEQIDSKFKGIIGFEFFITAVTDLNYSALVNEQYRVTTIYYKDAGFYLHLSMERYKDGAWSGYDSVTITLANAPTETGLMFLNSTYGRFRLAIIPSLMQAGRATNVVYTVKNSAINPFCIKLRSEFDKYTPYDSFGIKDTISNIVTVKQDGSGDYTTIGAAYDAVRAKSSFFNQYEIRVYPGVYEEYNLIPPPYSHTHGMFPNTVKVTSEGKTGTLPVFDQKQWPSKLSNMKIISATGYCIHVDNPLIHSVVDTNLYCKKVYSFDASDFAWQQTSYAAILGMGAQPAGMRVIFDGCTFEDGEVTCHTMSASEDNGDFYLELSNCKLVNARIRLQKAGNDGAALYGHYVCKIVNLGVTQGIKRPGIGLWYGVQASGLDYNFGWQIIGGNVNTGVEFLKSLDSTAPDCWENVQLIEKTYIRAKESIVNGQWITDDMIPAGANEKSGNIIGVALDSGANGDTVPVWTGRAFFVDLTDGEYGTDTNGNLSSSASEKIGKVKNGILYRYSM